MNLEKYIRERLNEIEKMAEFEVGTDTVRCWIDDYKKLLEKDELVFMYSDYLTIKSEHINNARKTFENLMLKVKVKGRIGFTSSRIPQRTGKYTIWFKDVEDIDFIDGKDVVFV